MKKYHSWLVRLAVVLTIILAHPRVQADDSKTFFMPRSINSMAFMHDTHANKFFQQKKKTNRIHVSATSFYQESVNRKNVGKYFFPHGKSELQLAGATSALAANEVDVSASWLQLAGVNTYNDAGFIRTILAAAANRFANASQAELYLNEYQSKIRIKPTYKSFGTVLTLQRYIPELCPKLWVSAQLPVVQVETSANLHERERTSGYDHHEQVGNFVLTTVGGAVRRLEKSNINTPLNAHQAFNNPTWHHGKFANNLSKAGPSDLELKVGYQLQECCNLYAKLTAPLSRRPRAEHIFEPLLGNGGHIALGGGVSYDTNLQNVIDMAATNIGFHTNLEYQYLFKNSQNRSFDLNGYGAWSRYFLVLRPQESEAMHQPGINSFTQRVDVTPQHEVNWNNAFSMAFNNWLSFDAGYNLWYKHKEKIEMREVKEQINIIEDRFDELGPFEPRVAPTNATIAMHINGGRANPIAGMAGAHELGIVGAERKIQAKDFNLGSGSHATTYSHTLFANANISTVFGGMPLHATTGAFYELGDGNKSLERWGLVFKLSFNC